ncbi:MAG: hypothetical protein ACPL3C_07405 [Pyrobaculum sp.]
MRAVRISPTEIVLLQGLFKHSILVECGDIKECDEIMEALKSGRPHEKLRDLMPLGVRPALPVEVLGDGLLASALRAALSEAGVKFGPGLKIYATDSWRPSLLRKVDEEARRSRHRYLPVFLALDLGVIGPLYEPGLPGYLCLEQQLTASTSWLFRSIRDYADKEELQPDPLYLKFLAYLTAVMFKTGAVEELRGRAVLVDFERFFIDVTRVYSTPLCEPYEVVSGL